MSRSRHQKHQNKCCKDPRNCDYCGPGLGLQVDKADLAEAEQLADLQKPHKSCGKRIDDLIDMWHSGAGAGKSLHEFLGWTGEEYSVWVKTGISPAAREVLERGDRVL